MKFTQLVFVFTTLTIASFVFRPVSAIIGGTPAEFYPFFVRVQKGRFVCGGTIIEANAVLTAAHCLFNRKEARWAFIRHSRNLSFFQKLPLKMQNLICKWKNGSVSRTNSKCMDISKTYAF